MEQGELILLIQSDVTRLKTHQKEHECQLETLAIEVHATNDRIDALEKTMNRRFRRLESDISDIKASLKIIINALAL